MDLMLHASGKVYQEPCIFFNISDISELDEGINLDPFPNVKYGQGDHIGTTWGS